MAYLSSDFTFSATGFGLLVQGARTWLSCTMPVEHAPVLQPILGKFSPAYLEEIGVRSMDDTFPSFEAAQAARASLLQPGAFHFDLSGHEVAAGFRERLQIRELRLEGFRLRFTAAEQTALSARACAARDVFERQYQMDAQTIIQPFEEPPFHTADGAQPQIQVARYILPANRVTRQIFKQAAAGLPMAAPEITAPLEYEVIHKSLGDIARAAQIGTGPSRRRLRDISKNKDCLYIRTYTV